MIVVDDPQEPQSPGERSPLKSPSVTTRAGLPPPQAPPPPYVASNADNSRPYFPTSNQGHLPPPVTLVLVHRRSALRRFLRAFMVAILVLFLWGVFVDTLSWRAFHQGNKGGGKHVIRRPNAMVCCFPGVVFAHWSSRSILAAQEWLVRNWYKEDPYAPDEPCHCSHDDLPVGSERPLPLQYPPVISKSEDVFSIAVPTSTSSTS